TREAQGRGDVTVRAKGIIRASERGALALGFDVRIPTGDELNLLGTGTIGLRPFGVWSQSSRISPHVNFGYQWNRRSLLGADVTSDEKARLPGNLTYSASAELGVTRRLTTTLDMVGHRVFHGSLNRLEQVPVPGACTTTAPLNCFGIAAQVTTISPTTGAYGINDAAIGIRLRPFGQFLITANTQLKLDSGGLRADYIPLISATYTFR